MDLAYFLNQRLNFVEYFHASTTATFEEIKRKIEAREPPYDFTRAPEYADQEYGDEPPYLEEWQMADDAITFTGAACLDLLKSTLHAFLDEYMDHIGPKQDIPKLKKKGNENWFRAYQVFFEKDLSINWSASGADLDLLEQVNLTRNDFAHSTNFFSLNTFQEKSHSEKFPVSAFADPAWKTRVRPRIRLIVPTGLLQRAIGALRSLCEHLERERYTLKSRRHYKQNNE